MGYGSPGKRWFSPIFPGPGLGCACGPRFVPAFEAVAPPPNTRVPARPFLVGFSAPNFPRVFLGWIGSRIDAGQITQNFPVVAPGFTIFGQPGLAVLDDTNQGQANQI